MAMQFLATKINRTLEKQVTKPTSTKWAGRTVFTPTKGLPKFCADLLRTNAVATQDSYLLLIMYEYFCSLKDAFTYSTPAACSVISKLKSANATAKKTVFLSHPGMYQYVRMLVGLKNAPVFSQKKMDMTLSSVECRLILVYFDNIILF